jgi:hypothetical protein
MGSGTRLLCARSIQLRSDNRHVGEAVYKSAARIRRHPSSIVTSTARMVFSGAARGGGVWTVRASPRCPRWVNVSLYHLTSRRSAMHIVHVDGEIRTTWPSTVSRTWPIRVVWLTSEPDPELQGWKVAEGPNTVRFTVHLPDDAIHTWADWAEGDRVDRVDAVSALNRWGDPSKWYVVERAIPRDEWAEVIDLATGQTLI